METRKILIAEDDKLLSTIFRMFLKELGYDLVGIVVDGLEAIEKCKELKPDVILMDIHLQGNIDGIETANIIQESLNLPVIFISHDTRDETIRSAISTQSYGFLAKPIDISSLGVSIEMAYHRHRNKQLSTISDQLYKTLIENSPDAVVVFLEDKIEYLNSAAMQLLCLNDINEVLHQSISNLFKEKATSIIIDEIDKAFKGNKKIEDIEIVIPKEPEDLFFKIFGTIIEFKGQNIVQLVLREN